MSIECIILNTDKQKKDFLKLPKLLYTKQDNPRDYKTEKNLLYGTHNLSKDFTVIPLGVYEEGKLIARCMVTKYPDNKDLYFGFFDAFNHEGATKLLMDTVMDMAAKEGYTRVVGPFDASFWIGYRLKIDKFDKHYTCEPYNKDYYYALLKSCGFTVCDEYVSNHYIVIPEGHVNPKYKKRLERLYEKGYTLVEANTKNFDKCLEDIYHSIIKLYSGFPTFTYISKEQFMEEFGSLKYILDYSMVKLAYKDGELQAFFINLPNYGNLTNNLNLIKLLKILKIRKKPSEYVLLYMGVDSKALGLGAALTEMTKDDLCTKKCSSIGALIHKGKVTGKFYTELIDDEYHYVLLNKEV